MLSGEKKGGRTKTNDEQTMQKNLFTTKYYFFQPKLTTFIS
jgi:hypothetical protein